MKILFVGQLGVGQTSRMRMEALAELGHDVVSLDSVQGWHVASFLSRHAQQALCRGPVVTRLNRELIELARRETPDLVWAEKQEYLYPETLLALRRGGARIVHFTPDPYFTLSWKRTPLMDTCLPLFDVALTAKRYELDEYRRVCREVVYLPLGFSEASHRPLSPVDADARRAYRSQISFVGGWEPRREQLLEVLARAGCDVKIWGVGWDYLHDGRWSVRRALRLRRMAGGQPFRVARNPSLSSSVRGGEIYGDRYAWAISGSAISIGFLRHICPDEHTTRTFEIPACGSLLLADRSDDHLAFFEEGKEAEFFSSAEELLDKTRFYLEHESARAALAEAGYRRCLRSGYSYRERLEAVLPRIAST